MKTRFILCTCALVLGVAMLGFAQDASDYPPIMKAAAAANAAMQKSVMTDLPATADNATALKNQFAKVEAFWMQRGSDDAVMFAKNIEKAADDVHAAAAAGKQDDATAAAKKVGANCGGCHMAHREKAADGGYQIK